MKFDEFLIALGLDRHLDLAAATQAGSCAIQFDKQLTVNIEHDNDKGVAHAYSIVCNASATHRDAFFAMLLQAHMFGAATEGCTFGFEPKQDQVILFKSIPLAKLDGPEAIAQLESLVNQAARWAAYLPHLLDEWEQKVTQAAVNVVQSMAAHG